MISILAGLLLTQDINPKDLKSLQKQCQTMAKDLKSLETKIKEFQKQLEKKEKRKK